MSSIDKKTLAGLLLGIGALAFAAKRGNQGSRGFFPAPTGKAPKGTDGFTEEQDDIFFSFKQNAPKRPTTESRYFTAEIAQKDKISALQSQKSAKQTQLQSIRKTIADNTFGTGGTYATLAQVQQEAASIQAQISDVKNTMEGLEISLQDPMLSADLVDDYENEFNAAKRYLQGMENRLSALNRTLPQSQKTIMQAQATSISAQIADLQNQITEANNKLVELEAQTAAASAKFGKPYTFKEYFTEFSDRGYDSDAKARYESLEAEKAWEDWEKEMARYSGWGEVAPKFQADKTDTSDAMSGKGAFKTGIDTPTVQGKFSGTSSSSDPFAPSFALPKIK
jgi:chromosome segregation ATPase